MKKYIAFLLVILALASGCAASDAGSRQAEATELPTGQPTEAPTEAPTETPVPTDTPAPTNTPRPLFNGPVGMSDREWELAFITFEIATKVESEMFEKTNVEFSDDKRTIFILTKIKDTSFANAKEIMKMAEEGGSFHDSLFAIMKTFANVLNTSVAGWSEAVAAYNEPEDGYGAIFDIYDVCFVFYDSETAQYFLKQAGTDELKVLPEHIFE